MSIRLLVVVIPFALACACGGSRVTYPAQRFAAASAPPPGFVDPARRAKLARAYPQLDAYFADYYAKNSPPGLAVGFVVDGELAWSKGYGVTDFDTKTPPDLDTVYEIASITKPLTALAALRLRDEGKLDFDVPAATYIPELAGVVYATRDAPPITLRHLLEHTSGLPNLGPLDASKTTPSDADVLAALSGLALRSAPGSREDYSSLGIALVGVAVARASGAPYRTAMLEGLLAPLGMMASTWDPARVPHERLAPPYRRGRRGANGAHARSSNVPLGGFEPAGGLYSSVRDMARFLGFVLDAWPERDDEDHGPVRRSSRREMAAMQGFDGVTLPRDGAPARAFGIGLGWGSSYECGVGQWFSMSGGAPEGYASMIRGLPEQGVAFVVMMNDFDGSLYSAIDWSHVVALLRDTGGLAKRVAKPNPALAEARAHLVRALFERYDPVEAARLFARPFEPAVAAPEWIRDSLGSLRREQGECRFDRDLPPRHAMEARWSMRCERGEVEVWASLASVAPLVIDAFSNGIGWEGRALPTDAGAPTDPRCE